MAKRSNRISEYFNCHVQFWSERHQEWRYWHNQGERAWDKKDLEQWGKKIQYNFQHLPDRSKFRIVSERWERTGQPEPNHLALETDILWEGVNEGIKDRSPKSTS